VLNVGDRAPDFTLPSLDGAPRTLGDALAGGPVLLAFWKAQCATSRLAFPYLERLRQAYPPAQWQLWGIGQDDPSAVETFLRRVGNVSIPILLDEPTYAVSIAYDPAATPTLFLVEPDGTIGQTSIAFSKADLNALSDRLAHRFGVPSVVVAPSDDGNPPFKPG
jgi:peroxiredoxin